MNASGSASTDYELLFSPLQVGPMRVPNRICETTNTIGATEPDGLPGERFIEHHVAKARGGTGWIGSETILLNSPMPAGAQDEFFPGAAAISFPIYNMPGFVEAMAKFCDAVHDAGAVAVFQLTHLNFTMAASSVPLVEPHDWIPHELDDGEIEFIINTYADAAAQLMAAGADGIEIHCAHETLPQTFLSPSLNKRTDQWGGDAQARIRFVVEILKRVRDRIADSMALGIRINGEEAREGGYTHLEMREMAYYIAEMGLLDFVNCDVGHCWGIVPYVQPSYFEHAEYREIGKAFRYDIEPVPLLFAGRVNDPIIAEQLIKDRVCDLVGMTRAGIADPDFANKAREGRLLEVRRCIACNRCIGEAVHSYVPQFFRKPVCSVNPVIGDELRWRDEYRITDEPRRVLVVGGGAAGLEAARVAAMRGHQVTLIERGPALGGQVRLAAKAPMRDAFEDFIYYEENQMELLGVGVQLETDASLHTVLGHAADVVICATGSVPRIPDTPGVDAPNVVQGWDVLAGRAQVGERVAVISQEDYFETLNVADYLADQGKRVEIFHKWRQIGAEIDRYSIGPAMRRLDEQDVIIHTGLRLRAIEERKLEFLSAYGAGTRAFDGFDSVVLVYGSVPDVTLYREMAADDSISRLYLIGSAWVPRRLAEATQHGARIGLEI